VLYCWGHNQYGQLGDPSFFHRRYVVEAPELMQSVSVVSVGQLQEMSPDTLLML
jgi:alpha-tubulin suppressor-like RCC1 family protein